MRRLLCSLLALGWSNALVLPETALMTEASTTFDLDDQSEAGKNFHTERTFFYSIITSIQGQAVHRNKVIDKLGKKHIDK